ncbi:uncharacterized protein LOC125422823 [Ziziphus jujuba]|uniref:Uncharacterized protein LOC125422823 n=1 Tax=Ziziphus jujuba TaxID=326968 RepID=A0ABM4A947_ZIZJJ|nr:uncharacterized protein LOC125422823 [Ziziphus jujuba]
MVPNMVAPRLSNPLLPEQPLMKSGGVEQFNQVPLSTPDVYNNLNNFTMNGPTPVLSRTQQASEKQQQASGVPTMGADHHPQHDNFELPESSCMQSRLTDEELRELMNAANKAKPVAAVPPYQNYILNSLTERERKDKNTGVKVPTQSKPSAIKPKEHGTSGRPRGRSSKRREGGSSVPSKRSRREAANKQEKTSAATKTAQEIVITADNIFTNPSLIRRVKNAVYDPMFEGMGLPIDPHLRMFTATNNKPN